jgi:hypothetical protein
MEILNIQDQATEIQIKSKIYFLNLILKISDSAYT